MATKNGLWSILQDDNIKGFSGHRDDRLSDSILNHSVLKLSEHGSWKQFSQSQFIDSFPSVLLYLCPTLSLVNTLLTL